MPRPRPRGITSDSLGWGLCSSISMRPGWYPCVSRMENASSPSPSGALPFITVSSQMWRPQRDPYLKLCSHPQPFPITLLGFCSSEHLSPSAISLPGHLLSSRLFTDSPNRDVSSQGAVAAGSLLHPQPRNQCPSTHSGAPLSLCWPKEGSEKLSYFPKMPQLGLGAHAGKAVPPALPVPTRHTLSAFGKTEV